LPHVTLVPRATMVSAAPWFRARRLPQLPGCCAPGRGLRSLGKPVTASRYLSDFGVAMYCGFGRQPGADGPQTMREHARVVRARRA
jgi:hypothetical protein